MTGLTDEIKSDALDPSSNLASTLRKCLALGGESGSEPLREWASLELKGYERFDDVPPYRRLTAVPLMVSGMVPGGAVSDQSISVDQLPDVAQEMARRGLCLTSGIAEIETSIHGAITERKGTIQFGFPGYAEIAALINGGAGGAPLAPGGHVDQIYWRVHVSALQGLVDQVRTIIVELTSEISAGLPAKSAVPSKDLADRAVNIAVHGEGHRIEVVTGSDLERSTARRVGYWLALVCFVVSAVVGVLLYIR